MQDAFNGQTESREKEVPEFFEIKVIEHDGQNVFLFEGEDECYYFNRWDAYYGTDCSLVTVDGDNVDLRLRVEGTHAPHLSWEIYSPATKRVLPKTGILHAQDLKTGDTIRFPSRSPGPYAFNWKRFETEIISANLHMINPSRVQPSSSQHLPIIALKEPKTSDTSPSPAALDAFKL